MYIVQALSAHIGGFLSGFICGVVVLDDYREFWGMHLIPKDQLKLTVCIKIKHLIQGIDSISLLHVHLCCIHVII